MTEKLEWHERNSYEYNLDCVSLLHINNPAVEDWILLLENGKYLTLKKDAINKRAKRNGDMKWLTT